MDRIARALELAQRQRRPGTRTRDDAEVVSVEYRHTRRMPVSRDHLRRARVLTGEADGITVDAYRLLRTRVLHRMHQNGWRTLGITSAGPKEGKSLTAINLAISIARDAERTALLVDADLRRPSVHLYLGLDAELGLGDFLNGADVERMLINPGIERLVILPGCSRQPVGPEQLASARMANLVHELGSRYEDRIVVFDLPPVLIGDDVLSMASNVDALLLVVSEGDTDARALARSLELLDEVPIIGTVLNKSSPESSSHGYYYYYYR